MNYNIKYFDIYDMMKKIQRDYFPLHYVMGKLIKLIDRISDQIFRRID